MRLLLVTHYYAEHHGGVEIVAGELAARLAERGTEIVWAASRPAPEALPRGITALPLSTWNVSEERLGLPYPIPGPVSLTRLWRAAQTCDVVHLHDCLYVANLTAWLAARLAGKPVVVTQHIGMVPYSSFVLRAVLESANRLLGRLVLGGSTRAVFISERVRSYFSERVRFRHAPLYIPNGVDTDLFHPAAEDDRQTLRRRLGWPPDRPVMLFVGRFVEKKGLPILRRLAKHFPECLWAFAGWGPDEPARWDLANVRCMGTLEHARTADCYRAADLLVLPSVGEGFPLVVQEAMACGTPALISADTALGATGIDRVAYVSDLEWTGLAALVSRLLASPADLLARRSQVAEFARRHWDWEHCAEQYCRVFCEVVGCQLSVPTAAVPGDHPLQQVHQVG